MRLFNPANDAPGDRPALAVPACHDENGLLDELEVVVADEDAGWLFGAVDKSRWLLASKMHGERIAAVSAAGRVLQRWEPGESLHPYGMAQRDYWVWPLSDDKPSTTVLVGRLGEPSIRRVTLSGGYIGERVGVTPQGRLLALSAPMADPATAVTLREYDLRVGSIGASWRVALPGTTATWPDRLGPMLGGRHPKAVIVLEAVLSPHGDKIAWLLRRQVVQPEFRGGSLRSMSQTWTGRRSEVWISGIDGSGMKELAHDEPILERGETHSPDIHALTWLPGGKAVSLTKADRLYVMRTDRANRYSPQGVLFTVREGLEMGDEALLQAVSTPEGFASLRKAVRALPATPVARQQMAGRVDGYAFLGWETVDRALAVDHEGKNAYARLERVDGEWRLERWLAGKGEL